MNIIVSQYYKHLPIIKTLSKFINSEKKIRFKNKELNISGKYINDHRKLCIKPSFHENVYIHLNSHNAYVNKDMERLV